MSTKLMPVIVIESASRRGRWHFATPAAGRPGTMNLSLRTWASARAALRAGQREYGQCS